MQFYFFILIYVVVFMFTLTKISDGSYIINSGGFYYFAQIIYISLIIAVVFTIINFIYNTIFFRKNKEVLKKLKGLKKIKILNLVSLVLFPASVIGMIVFISFL